jgi:hypothetical protein
VGEMTADGKMHDQGALAGWNRVFLMSEVKVRSVYNRFGFCATSTLRRFGTFARLTRCLSKWRFYSKIETSSR